LKSQKKATLNEVKGPKCRQRLLAFLHFVQDKRSQACPAGAGIMTGFFSDLVLDTEKNRKPRTIGISIIFHRAPGLLPDLGISAISAASGCFFVRLSNSL
jgi:hypothetical protein